MPKQTARQSKHEQETGAGRKFDFIGSVFSMAAGALRPSIGSSRSALSASDAVGKVRISET